jgi:hypothetical protein
VPGFLAANPAAWFNLPQHNRFTGRECFAAAARAIDPGVRRIGRDFVVQHDPDANRAFGDGPVRDRIGHAGVRRVDRLSQAEPPGMRRADFRSVARVIAVEAEWGDEDRTVDADTIHGSHHLVAADRCRSGDVPGPWAAYAALAGEVDAVVNVTAPGAAPVGLATTGNPIFVVPGSMLGAPSVSLPVLDDGGLPLGLQVLGFPQGDAGVFAVAGWIEDALSG